MKKPLAAAIFISLFVEFVAAQQNQNLNSVEIHTLPVQGNVYMLVGAGGNMTVQVGNDGVLIVDTQYAPLSEKILAAIRTLSKGPIRYVINTTYDADHTGGNEPILHDASPMSGGAWGGDSQEFAGGSNL